MAQLQQPNAGQPLDVQFIGNIVTAINTLDTVVSSSASSVIAGNSTPVKTSSVVFSSQTLTLNLNGKALGLGDASSQLLFSFGLTFKNIPVVTATMENSAQASKNKSFVVNIKKITKTDVTLELISLTEMSGIPDTIKVHVIAIGTV